jgi:hypothetical protein
MSMEKKLQDAWHNSRDIKDPMLRLAFMCTGFELTDRQVLCRQAHELACEQEHGSVQQTYARLRGELATAQRELAEARAEIAGLQSKCDGLLEALKQKKQRDESTPRIMDAIARCDEGDEMEDGYRPASTPANPMPMSYSEMRKCLDDAQALVFKVLGDPFLTPQPMPEKGKREPIDTLPLKHLLWHMYQACEGVEAHEVEAGCAVLGKMVEGLNHE